jgi:hypothetical protein
MRLTTIFLCIFSATLFGFTVLHKNETVATWKFIGDKTVSFGVDRDVIHVGNKNDEFRQLKVKVTDGPLKFYDMKVHFDNGDVQDVQLRSLIRKGGESRVIDLNGGLRRLKKVEFWYETKGFARGRARVALWGKN